ncbi:MAG: hypothetical protein WDA27_13790 [Actinomycetota bacterium]
MPRIPASAWEGSYSASGSGFFEDSAHGRTNYPSPDGVFTGLGTDSQPRDGASSEAYYRLYPYFNSPTTSQPNWYFTWNMRPTDYAMTEISLTFPIQGRGPWASWNFPLKSPLPWLSLPVGHVSHSSTRFEGAHALTMRRMSSTSWRIEIALRRSGGAPGDYAKSGRFTMTTDRPLPPWNSIRLRGGDRGHCRCQVLGVVRSEGNLERIAGWALRLHTRVSGWAWKDSDELDWSVEARKYSREEAAKIREEGLRVAKRLEVRAWPFHQDWSAWRPSANWPVPGVPEDWNDATL